MHFQSMWSLHTGSLLLGCHNDGKQWPGQACYWPLEGKVCQGGSPTPWVVLQRLGNSFSGYDWVQSYTSAL